MTSSRKQPKPRILILYTGGTFGMDRQLKIPPLTASLLKKRFFERVPEIRSMAHCEVEVLFQLDSCQIHHEHWHRMADVITAKQKAFDGFVILHGTDTLAYTASALSFLLPSLKKPVILTGAQKPLSALRTDARRNLIAAIEIATTGPKKITQGVNVFFDRKLFFGTSLTKKSATDFDAFTSPKAPILAVVGTEIQYSNALPQKPHIPQLERSQFDPQIAVLNTTPMAPWGHWIQQDWSWASAIILSTYASGTAPTDHPDFMSAIRLFLKYKIPVILHTDAASQVQRYESTQELLSLGCLDGSSLTFETAWIKASWLLGSFECKRNPREFARLWKTHFKVG